MLYNMDLLGCIMVVFLALVLLYVVVSDCLYDVEVIGKKFHEMTTSEKKELLMSNPKSYKEMKKLGDLYRKLYEDETL